MAQISKLAYRDGWLCAVDSYPKYDEPIQITHYWPLAKMNHADAAEYVGKEAISSGNPFYTYDVLDMGGGFHRPKFQLAQGGETKAIAVDETPIPAPKTRCETRYYNGRWEKYLRSSGYVAA